MSKVLHNLRLLSQNIMVASAGQAQQPIKRSLPSITNAIQRVSTSAQKQNRSSQQLHPPIIINPKSYFSTAPQQTIQNDSSTSASQSSSSSQRKRPKRKDPLVITPAAANRIKELLSSPNGENAIGIRLGVKRRGCNGLSYTLNYAFEREPNEEEMEAHGVRIMIEPMALFNVVGTVMDWVETDMSSEFTFENPNSKGECGCGESFNV